jgi:hypothetical protein
VEAQTGRVETAGRVLEKLTRPARIVPHHRDPCTYQLSQCLRPGDLSAPEQTCIPLGGLQQGAGLRRGSGRSQSGPGAKVEEEYAHLLYA